MSGVFTAAAAGSIGSFFSAYPIAGTIAAGIGSSVAGAGVSAALAPHSRLTIPPPPGAAMIDPAGSQAAAMERERQSVAGGLSSTQTGAGAGPGGTALYSSATGGGKSLLGQ